MFSEFKECSQAQLVNGMTAIMLSIVAISGNDIKFFSLGISVMVPGSSSSRQ